MQITLAEIGEIFFYNTLSRPAKLQQRSHLGGVVKVGVERSLVLCLQHATHEDLILRRQEVRCICNMDDVGISKG